MEKLQGCFTSDSESNMYINDYINDFLFEVTQSELQEKSMMVTPQRIGQATIAVPTSEKEEAQRVESGEMHRLKEDRKKE